MVKAENRLVCLNQIYDFDRTPLHQRSQESYKRQFDRNSRISISSAFITSSAIDGQSFRSPRTLSKQIGISLNSRKVSREHIGVDFAEFMASINNMWCKLTNEHK